MSPLKHLTFLLLLCKPDSSSNLPDQSISVQHLPPGKCRPWPQCRLGFFSLASLYLRSHGLPLNLSTQMQGVPKPPPPDLTGLPFSFQISSSLLATATWTIHCCLEPCSASSSPKPVSVMGEPHPGPHISLMFGSIFLLSSMSILLQISHFLHFKLCPHGVLEVKMDGQSTTSLLDLYKQKRSRSRECKSNLNHKKRATAPRSIPRLEPVCRPRTLNWGGG